jgi:hypothetical protein
MSNKTYDDCQLCRGLDNFRIFDVETGIEKIVYDCPLCAMRSERDAATARADAAEAALKCETCKVCCDDCEHY